ncbi:hypothetical protein B0H11DRAFT_1905969 [Mycena galericulata]|nr:hypothetical protein B0H11DRAFT_1905969 [Mycena galericulata]
MTIQTEDRRRLKAPMRSLSTSEAAAISGWSNGLIVKGVDGYPGGTSSAPSCRKKCQWKTFISEDVLPMLKVQMPPHPYVRILEYLDVCNTPRPSKFKRCEPLLMVTSSLDVCLDKKWLAKIVLVCARRIPPQKILSAHEMVALLEGNLFKPYERAIACPKTPGEARYIPDMCFNGLFSLGVKEDCAKANEELLGSTTTVALTHHVRWVPRLSGWDSRSANSGMTLDPLPPPSPPSPRSLVRGVGSNGGGQWSMGQGWPTSYTAYLWKEPMT